MLNPTQRRRVIAGAARRIAAGEVTHPRLAKFRAAREVVGRRCRPDELPTDGEIRDEVRRLLRPGAESAADRADFEVFDEDPEDDLPPERFEIYRSLLEPLAAVRMPPKWHPEGDALTHSLQVATLAGEVIPYDEEFRLAALLHEVGRGLDAVEPVEAAVAALVDLVTPRTLWFIENLPDALRIDRGESGMRTRRRLAASPDFEALRTLADCDRRGRQRAMAVPLVDEALADLAAPAV